MGFDTVSVVVAIAMSLSRLLAMIFIIGGAFTIALIWVASDHVDLTMILVILIIGHFYHHC